MHSFVHDNDYDDNDDDDDDNDPRNEYYQRNLKFIITRFYNPKPYYPKQNMNIKMGFYWENIVRKDKFPEPNKSRKENFVQIILTNLDQQEN